MEGLPTVFPLGAPAAVRQASSLGLLMLGWWEEWEAKTKNWSFSEFVTLLLYLSKHPLSIHKALNTWKGDPFPSKAIYKLSLPTFAMIILWAFWCRNLWEVFKLTFLFSKLLFSTLRKQAEQWMLHNKLRWKLIHFRKIFVLQVFFR